VNSETFDDIIQSKYLFLTHTRQESDGFGFNPKEAKQSAEQF
jgi:hypothetical protein